tara:strand:- start:1036 stop:1254 length:219 start_codon:yes stop_codon:yes gene_type:complete
MKIADIFPTHESMDGNLVITGTKDNLDAAYAWLEALFRTAMTDEEAAEQMREIPAMVGLLMYRTAVEHAPEA